MSESQTPRTDAEAGEYSSVGYWRSKPDGECVSSDFARQLESELTATRARLAELEGIAEALIINIKYPCPSCNVNKLGLIRLWERFNK